MARDFWIEWNLTIWLFNSGMYQDPFLATYAAADRYQVTMATISICLLSQDFWVEHPRNRDYNLTEPLVHLESIFPLRVW